MRDLLLASLVPMTLCVLFVLVLRPFAKSMGLVDYPSGHSNHSTPTPLIGGIAIVLAIACSALLLSDWPAYATGLGYGLALIFLVGTADDRKPIRARYRLMVQLTAGFGAIFLGGTLMTDLQDCFAAFNTPLGLLSVPFTIVCFAGLINAFNMSDGADGLCAGYSLSSLVFLLIAASLVQSNSNNTQAAFDELSPIMVPAIGALMGFLGFNLRHRWRSKASIFLGDGGSMAMGFIVAWLCIRLSANYGDASIPPATALWIVALPLIDMFCCISRRVFIDHVTPMSPDKKHLHHLLIQHGLSVTASVRVLHLIAITFAAIGVAGWQAGIPQYLLFWALVMVLLVQFVYSNGFWQRQAATAQPAPSMPPAPVQNNDVGFSSIARRDNALKTKV